jgi:hypothetical protein
MPKRKRQKSDIERWTSLQCGFCLSAVLSNDFGATPPISLFESTLAGNPDRLFDRIDALGLRFMIGANQHLG